MPKVLDAESLGCKTFWMTKVLDAESFGCQKFGMPKFWMPKCWMPVRRGLIEMFVLYTLDPATATEQDQTNLQTMDAEPIRHGGGRWGAKRDGIPIAPHWCQWDPEVAKDSPRDRHGALSGQAGENSEKNQIKFRSEFCSEFCPFGGPPKTKNTL
jgi:hypothetical protein